MGASPQADSVDVPETMHAAAIDAFGGPEVLALRQLPVPAVDKDDVLIAVDTAAVGGWDAEMRAGSYPGGLHFPLVLGTDGSGKIVAMGSHVRRFRIGDAVYSSSFANPKGGFYAEYVAVQADRAAPVPKGLSMQEAGAIPATGLTAIQGIDDALHVHRGQAVAIVGASGGVGTLAVQFGKLREARVLAVASGKEGVALVQRLGADLAVDGRHDDVAAVVKKFAPDGLDAILALAGGEILDQIVAELKSGGLLAYPNGVYPEPKNRPGSRVIPYDAVAGVRQFNQLGMAVEAANLQVPIAARFPLGQASLAHKRLAQGRMLGKIVLEIA
jgi:NADPH:quinone reductase-like Zn-dependent oxidoreductase